MRAYLTVLCLVSAAVTLGACEDDPGQLRKARGRGDRSGEEGTPGGEVGIAGVRACGAAEDAGSYLGLGGVALDQGRANEETGANRSRMKPLRVLEADYARVLGKVPASFAAAAPSLEDPKARWFEEPRATSLGLGTLFNVAFDGCLDYVAAQPSIASAGAPTASNTNAPCAAMMRAFWERAPSNEEVRACADLAAVATAKEPDPKRRWAYACASVLTAEPFLYY